MNMQARLVGRLGLACIIATLISGVSRRHCELTGLCPLQAGRGVDGARDELVDSGVFSLRLSQPRLTIHSTRAEIACF